MSPRSHFRDSASFVISGFVFRTENFSNCCYSGSTLLLRAKKFQTRLRLHAGVIRAVGVISRSSEAKLSFLSNKLARATGPASKRQSDIAR